MVLTFKSVNETLVCDHSNKSYWAVLSCGTVYYAVQGGSNVLVCGWNPSVWPFKWKLLSRTLMWYWSLCCTRWFLRGQNPYCEIACEQAPCESGKNSASEVWIRERSECLTPSWPDRSRLAPLVLDYTRLSRPKPNREPVRRLIVRSFKCKLRDSNFMWYCLLHCTLCIGTLKFNATCTMNWI